jgi:hypothetical protein
VIDCDVHPQIGDLEQFLAYVDPAQREWFQNQEPLLGLPSYTPHWDFDDPAFMLRRLPEAWREPVLHGNAAELYGSRLGLVASP